MNNASENAKLLRAKLNSETARINWKELERFFAAGKSLCVEPELDLIDVAFALQQDNTELVQQWLDESRVSPVSDAQAKDWVQAKTLLWAIVVKPWVLVQVPN